MEIRFFELLIYKAKQAVIIPYLWVVKFEKGNYKKAYNVCRFFMISIFISYGIEVMFACTDYIMTEISRSNRDTSGEKIQSELEFVYMDIIQICCAMITIYLLVFFSKF